MGAPRVAARAGLAANLALSAAALLLGFAALELLARALLSRTAEPVASQYTEFDPLLGWRHRPGARVRFAQGDYAINALGLRDRERRFEAAPGTHRLLVLGDSFAEGFSVPFEDSAAQVLERSLSRAECLVEVIAAGTVGYSTDQEYLYYREEGRRFGPQAVLLFFYYNDVIYNARESVGRAPKPLLSFAGGTPRLKNTPLVPPDATSAAAAGRTRGSVAWQWVTERLRTGAPGTYDALAALRLAPRREPVRAGSELLVYSRNPPRDVQDAWAQTLNILGALRDDTARAGARLLVVYVPSKMEIDERDWELTQELYGAETRSWDRRRVIDWLLGAGRTLGIPVLDTTAGLRRQQRGSQSTYHARGGHWSRAGHATAALEVLGELGRQGMLPACAAR
jgi:hypothetical protein